ncbi:MAG: thioester dehydrase [Fibrobacter sp.]|nr:thioester dehydrase [Fibrobacter sp.]
MKEVFDSKDLVSELVPHKGKMFLLDRIRDYDLNEKSITTEIDITRDNLLYEEELGGVPVWVAFEYMAQSVSALSGIYGRSKGEKPKTGFILSVNGFKADVPVFKQGETVVVNVQEKIRVDQAVTFDGVAMVGNKVVVTAKINTVEVDDSKNPLNLI